MVQTDLLDLRYPNLSFLLRFNPCSRSPIRDETIQLKAHRELHVIYIYGIGDGEVYHQLKGWLNEDKERDLVFLEEDLGAIESFLEVEGAKEITMHPQVHIRFNLDPKRQSAFAKECAESFPYEKIGVFALPSYRRKNPSKFYRLRLKLQRYTTIEYATYLENYYYSHLFKNLHPNIFKLEQSFNGNALKGAFENIPAIIVGAGPSLEKDLETLKTLTDKALIFAGGSAITATIKKGISPHFGVAIDPNEEEVKRFKEIGEFTSPLLYAPRLHKEVLPLCSGKLGYLHTQTGGAFEKWMEEKLDLHFKPLQEGFSREALSVTTTAIEVAATLGCNPIILVGVDLAYTDGRAYSSGIESASNPFEQKKNERVSERIVTRKDIHGHLVQTLVKWVMESSDISRFARKNPELKLINASSGGIGFKGIKNVSLSRIPLEKSFDLYSQVEKHIHKNLLNIPKGKIHYYLGELKLSLTDCRTYIKLALEELEKTKDSKDDPETGRLIFAQMELETLDAYQCFLKHPDRTFLPTLERKYRPSKWDEVDVSLKWKYLYSKWKSYESLIDLYVNLLA